MYYMKIVHLSAVEPVAMKYLDDGSVNNELVVEQGKTFDVQLSCVDASGEVVTLGEPLFNGQSIAQHA